MRSLAGWRKRGAGWQSFWTLMPGVTIARIRDGQPAKDPSRMAAILDGLRLAGLDEG